MVKQQESSSHAGLFETVASQAALLGSPARLKILLLLAQSPRSVEALALETRESVANTSQHLKKLREGELVNVERSGVSRIYRLADERVALVVETLFDLAELRSSAYREASRLLAEQEELSSLSVEQMRREIQEERAVLIDVRDTVESCETPVSGAVSIPLSELEAELIKLSRTKTYFVVCRGRACGQATQGVRLLRKRGLQAYRVKESPAALRLKARSLLASKPRKETP